MIGDYFKVGLRNVREKKLRSWLTMIGIFVSIAIIFVLVSLSIGLSGFVQETFEDMGMEVIIIMPMGQMGGLTPDTEIILTKDHVDQIKRIGGVEDVSYEIVETGYIEYGGQERFILVAGLSENVWDLFEGMDMYSIKEGDHLRRGDTGRVVLGSAFSEDFFDREIYVGDSVIIEGERFRVYGITETMGTDMHDQIAMLLSDDMRKIFDIENRVDQIHVKVESYERMEEVEEMIIDRLDRVSDLEEEDYFMITPEQILSIFDMILNIITGFLLSIAGISLFVGAIGISNTMYTSVLERTKEIGVMKAIGAKNKDVLSLFVIEAGILGIIGGIIGVGVGFLMARGVEYAVYLATGVDYLTAATPLWLIVSCISFAFVVGALSGSLPALQAARVEPTEALREE